MGKNVKLRNISMIVMFITISIQSVVSDLAADILKADVSVVKQFMQLVGEGNEEGVKELCARYDHLLNYQADITNGWLALHNATYKGQKNIVKLLLNLKANINAKTNERNTSLHIAAGEGNENIIKILLENKADPYCINNQGNTPLHLAAGFGTKESIGLLLSCGVSRDLRNNFGLTAQEIIDARFSDETMQGVEDLVIKQNRSVPLIKQFIYAAKKGDEVSLKMLYEENDHLRVYKDGINYQDGLEEWSALHHAVKAGKENTIRLLLSLKADIHAKTSNQNTPLHIAVYGGNEEVVRLLLDNQANVHHENEEGNTPLHLAAERDNVVGGIFLLLSSYGARSDLLNKFGKTPNDIIIEAQKFIDIVPSAEAVPSTEEIFNVKKKRLRGTFFSTKQKRLKSGEKERDKENCEFDEFVDLVGLPKRYERTRNRSSSSSSFIDEAL